MGKYIIGLILAFFGVVFFIIGIKEVNYVYNVIGGFLFGIYLGIFLDINSRFEE